MNKIIFINRYFYPDHSATSQMLSDLAFSLATCVSAKEIHIVTSQQKYDDPLAKLVSYDVIKKVHIHRVRTTKFGRNNLIGRTIDYMSFYFSATLKLICLTKTGDILVAKTDPPLISVVVATIAKFKKAILINWLQDVFPEVARGLGIKLAQGLSYQILKKIRNKSLMQAQMNVVIGELMADKLIEEGVSEKKIKVIHNWADEKQIRPVLSKLNPLRKEWGLDRKFVVGYSGNLGRVHDFSLILAAAEALKYRSDIRFLFIGGGMQMPNIKKLCEKKALNNILFKPYQPREILSESLSVSDVHLISLKPELEGLIVPSKFYGICAIGKPIIFIGAEDGEVSKIIKNNNCGYSVLPDDIDLLIKSILDLIESPETQEAMKNNSRNVFKSKYEFDAALTQWKKILNIE